MRHWITSKIIPALDLGIERASTDGVMRQHSRWVMYALNWATKGQGDAVDVSLQPVLPGNNVPVSRGYAAGLK